MVAFASVSPRWDLGYICTQAGQPDPEKRHYRTGVLYVSDIDQAALDQAISAYSHLERRKALMKQQLRRLAKEWLENQYDFIDLVRGVTGNLPQGELDTMTTRLNRAVQFVQDKIAEINAATTEAELDAISLTP